MKNYIKEVDNKQEIWVLFDEVNNLVCGDVTTFV